MPYYDFTVTVDAVKLIPADRQGLYQLRWFLNDRHKGVSQPTPRAGDEAALLHTAQFGVEAKGVITQLLQLSVVELASAADDAPQLVGVLMIDLNAHVPRPPKASSRQRATLNLSRCPFPQPLLMRMTLECRPALPPAHLSPRSTSAASVPSTPADQHTAGIAQVPRSVSRAALSDVGSASPAAGDDAVAHLKKMRAAVATLTASNDQLKDENRLLHRAVDRARLEPEFTTSTKAMADGAAETELLSQDVGVLTGENRTLRAEMAVVRKGLQTAKEQLRALMAKHEAARADGAAAEKARAFAEAELARVRRETGEARQAQRVSASDELCSLREMLAVSQQTCNDLRAMVHSSDTLTDSLQRELRAARDDAQRSGKTRDAAVGIARQRADDFEEQAHRAGAALRIGQGEIEKLHSYSAAVTEKLKGCAERLQVERAARRRLQCKMHDVQAVLVAQSHAKHAAETAPPVLPQFFDPSGALDSRLFPGI
jgi:hypothetical protein